MTEAPPRGVQEEMRMTIPQLGFLDLVLSDQAVGRATPEPRWRAIAMILPRLLLNPSLQLAFLVRVAQKGPRAICYPVRLLQVALFSSEIYWFHDDDAIAIGPGIAFPHPINIIIGPGTRIGSNVWIYNNQQIGTDREFGMGKATELAPWIGDGATIYAYAIVQGPWRIGDGAVVGLRVFLDEDVPPGALKTIRRVRLRGEWSGVTR